VEETIASNDLNRLAKLCLEEKIASNDLNRHDNICLEEQNLSFGRSKI
jgi:hypothetical protein